MIPDFVLSILQPSQYLRDSTCRTMEKLGTILLEEKPNLILIPVDTTPILSVLLAAYYQPIPIGHLGTYFITNLLSSPWPKARSLIVTSQLTSWHVAKRYQARTN